MIDLSGHTAGSRLTVFAHRPAPILLSAGAVYAGNSNTALTEFLRMLRPEGVAVIACPDLQEAARMIAEDKLMDTAYQSLAGPVTPFDIVYSPAVHREG